MARLSASELAMIFVPLLSLILGIAQVCSETAVLESTHDVSLTGWPRGPIYFGPDSLSSVPYNFLYSVSQCLLGAGAITIIASVFAVLQAIDTLYPGSLFRHWHALYRGVLYPSIVVILSIFIFACVEESRSSHWQYSDTDSTDGRYAPESWNCQIKPYFSRLHSVCNSARAGRWLALPILASLGALAAIDIRLRPRSDGKPSVKGYLPR